MASDAVQELRQHAINGWVAYGARQMDRETALRLLVEYEDALIAAVRADEKYRCIAVVEGVEVWNRDSADAKRDIAEAIRNA